MNISLNGFNESMITFACGEEIPAKTPVKITDNNTVSPCGNSEAPIGFAVNSKCGYTGVMMNGYFNTSYSGTMSYGYQKIAADANGGVKKDDNGIMVIVTEIDTANKTVGFIM